MFSLGERNIVPCLSQWIVLTGVHSIRILLTMKPCRGSPLVKCRNIKSKETKLRQFLNYTPDSLYLFMAGVPLMLDFHV